MRIALYHNAWHICGGGELYLGTLAEEWSRHHEVVIPLTAQLDRARLRTLLGLGFERVTLLPLEEPLPNPRQPSTRAQRLRREWLLARLFRGFDVTVRVAQSVVPLPAGRRTLLHVQVPWVEGDRGLRGRLRRLWNRRVAGLYDRVLFNSRFTEGTVALGAGRGVVLYPPIAEPGGAPRAWHLRARRILSVGRFMAHGHCKRQVELVAAFRRLVDQGLTGWTLTLVGGVNPDPSSTDYLERVRRQAAGLPVELVTDLARSQLERLYDDSRIYWHATGLGIDEVRHPDRVEHFGITTVEAMIRGVIPVVIDMGGQREIVQHGETGYRWRTVDELVQATWRVIQSEEPVDDERGGGAEAMAQRAAQASERFRRSRFAATANQLLF